MKERIKLAWNQPSLVTELLKKKNRKCLIALVLLTFAFFVVIPTVKAAGNAQIIFSAEAGKAYDKYIGKDAIIPGTTVKSKAGSMARKAVAMAATVGAFPIYLLELVPETATDVLTLKEPAANAGLAALRQGMTGGLIGAVAELKNVVINSAIPAFSAIGIAIAAIHFLVGMIGMVTSDRMTIESWIKYWAKLIVSIAAILYSADLFELFWDFGNAITTYTADKISFASVGAANPYDQMFYGLCKILDTLVAPSAKTVAGSAIAAATGLGSIVGLIVAMFVALLFMCMGIMAGICMLVVMVLAITRVLEITIRGAFLPIGIASLSDDGWHGSGGRYFKKLFAVAIQSGLIIFVCEIMMFLFARVLANMVNGMGVMFAVSQSTTLVALEAFINPIMMTLCMLVITIAGIAAMFKSSQMANDIIGA